MELQELLLAREKRAAHQKELLEEYNSNLICFTMNIPGPVKKDPLITEGFQLGHQVLKAQFPQILYEEQRLLDTGCEGYYILPGRGKDIKSLCIQIEEQHPLGRLLDLDVITSSGEKLSRPHPRSCFLCGEDARICRRSGKHSIESLIQRTRDLLQEAVDQDLAQRVETLAVRSLLYELFTTPKPGLVDLNNSGSHQDMDPFTFLRSASALGPYFRQCTEAGIQGRKQSSEDLLPILRFIGRQAESAMYSATGGVNTHKGAIFSLGLLCAAAGRLGSPLSPNALCAEAAAIVKGITERELRPLTQATAQTKGELLYLTHHIRGVRGQAEDGFPAVLDIGLPILTYGLKKGLSVHEAGAAALLAMLEAEPDTSFLSRSSPQRYSAICQELKKLLTESPYPAREALLEWDQYFIRENLSPGGSADLLALTYFLYEIAEGR